MPFSHFPNSCVVTARLPRSKTQLVQGIARRNGMSVSQFIRLAIDSQIDADDLTLRAKGQCLEDAE